jgi:hypothetical protein
MELIEGQDAPRVGGKPPDVARRERHREDALAIGAEQRLGWNQDCHANFISYAVAVKIAVILCSVCLGALLGGCAVSESSADEVGQQFQEGIQGRGQIVPNNPTSDSFGSDYQ